MGRAAVVHRQSKLSPAQMEWPERVADDERWGAAQRVVASANFSRSPLLSRFLLYIVAESIEGRGQEITEHQIGVKVFDRPPSYRTVEDNIVRNYARQLRKRLADYYNAEGKDEAVKIDIPLGAYIPVFSAMEPPAEDPQQDVPQLPRPQVVQRFKAQSSLVRRFLRGPRIAWIALVFVLYTALIGTISWFIVVRMHNRTMVSSAADPLWHAIFSDSANTYIVPSDAGFNLLEDVSHQNMPLADYMKGDYSNLSLPALDTHSAEDLRSQQFTSFVDLQTITALERLPEFHPERDMVRFPRNLHIEDLKSANAIILGSSDSNPWASIAEANANFQIIDRSAMSGAMVINHHPQHGEQAKYVSHWNEPAHETYALIQFLPNLDGTGHILLLQGLDVAGTQAAAEMLLHSSAIAPILKRARQPDGKLRSFEILLRATSLVSNATGTQVIASRIY